MAGATEGMASREELSAAVDDAKPRPKANLAATAIKDVYPVETLIGTDIMKATLVKSWQDSAKTKKEVVTKSKYVAHRLNKVATDVQKLKILRYLYYLLEFYGSTKAKGRGNIRRLPKADELRTLLYDIPPTILEAIKRKFSDGGEMLKFQTDLLITHICALACLVDNYEVDMLDLKDDLQLESKEIGQYFQEIGARVVPANEAQRKELGLDKAAAMQHKFAKLRLPLEFPKAKFARKQR
jgi:DNA-directed RNA polymerase I subunit RPA49